MIGETPMQSFGEGSYAPPQVSRGRPAVILCYRLYAGSVVALFVAFFVFWLAVMPFGREQAFDLQDQIVFMVLFGLVALVGGGFYTAAALVPYKPWGWTFALIAIGLGIPSCMFVVAIPLLVFWFRPETKAAFCRL